MATWRHQFVGQVEGRDLPVGDGTARGQVHRRVQIRPPPLTNSRQGWGTRMPTAVRVGVFANGVLAALADLRAIAVEHGGAALGHGTRRYPLELLLRVCAIMTSVSGGPTG